jgi:hypothetical protein
MFQVCLVTPILRVEVLWWQEYIDHGLVSQRANYQQSVIQTGVAKL